MTTYTQHLLPEQHVYIEKIKLALKEKTKGNHNRPKAVQKLIDYCIKNGIKPEDIVK